MSCSGSAPEKIDEKTLAAKRYRVPLIGAGGRPVTRSNATLASTDAAREAPCCLVGGVVLGPFATIDGPPKSGSAPMFVHAAINPAANSSPVQRNTMMSPEIIRHTLVAETKSCCLIASF